MPPFLLGDLYGDARMGMAWILGVCFAFLFASSVTASTIDVGPSDWRQYGPNGSHTAQGVKSTFGQNVRLPPTISGPTRILPVNRNPVIPYGSIANGMKNFTRVNPQSIAASAAITALFLGLDWAFDDEIDSWMKEGESSLIDPPDLVLWSITSQAGVFEGPTPDSVCMPAVTASSSSYTFLRSEVAGSIVNCIAITPDWPDGVTVLNGSRVSTNCPSPSFFDPVLGGCVIEGEYEVLTDFDFTELANTLPSSNPVDVAEAAGDVMKRQGSVLPGYQDLTMTGPSSVSGPEITSTSTDPVTGETTVTNTSTTTNINYGDTTITTTNTTTSTTYQNGQQTGETVTTETPGELPVESGGGVGGASGDWPGFCSWATVVCDWFNWTQEEPPPEQDLPSVIDDDFYQEKTISFGAKSCPPDHQIDLAPFLATSVAVSFQPLCDFAGLIYYMVMAASYIIAAYITIGVARNG